MEIHYLALAAMLAEPNVLRRWKFLASPLQDSSNTSHSRLLLSQHTQHLAQIKVQSAHTTAQVADARFQYLPHPLKDEVYGSSNLRQELGSSQLSQLPRMMRQLSDTEQWSW